MIVKPRSLRIPPKILKKIKQISAEMRKDFSSVTNQLLEEAVKSRQCPGIVFTEGVRAEQRARIAGTGLDVWEVIESYLHLKKDFSRLSKMYHWLTETQLQAALGYYQAYPKEIDFLIRRNQSWTEERIRKEYPFMTPRKK